MSNRPTRRRLAPIAVLVVSGLVGTGGFAAATPSPDGGPTAGGTVVSDSVPGFAFVDVSAGGVYSVALGEDGLLYSWGQDTQGQLGNGAEDAGARTSPGPLDTPSGLTFTQVAAGFTHALALGSDGVVYAWGSNDYGELGNGTTDGAASPTPVSMPAGVTVVALNAGNDFSAALLSDGRLLMWGDNANGQLGSGSWGSQSTTPREVSMPAGVGVTTMSAGSSRANSMLVVGTDGQTYGWGSAAQGAIGNGRVGGVEYTPVLVSVPPGVRFTQVTSGWWHSLAIAEDGTLWAWGDNSSGQLGDGTVVDHATPARVVTDPALRFTAITSSTTNSGALSTDGVAYTWGETFYGMIGDGVSGTFGTVRVPTAAQLPGGTRLTALRQGGVQVNAIAEDGTVYSWGTGPGLGLGGANSVPLPAAQPGGLAVEQVTFGGIPGTDITVSAESWSATTPGGCGPVDVTVGYRVFGGPMQQQTTEGGFTYGAAPAFVDQPQPLVIDAGQAATFSVSVDGDDAPTIQWQTRAASGTWTDVPGATGDSVTLTPAVTAEVRAVASNCLGTVVSDVATLTVADPPSAEPNPTPTPAPVPDSDGGPSATAPPDAGEDPTNPVADTRASELAITGSAVAALVGLAALLVAAGALLVLSRRHRAP